MAPIGRLWREQQLTATLIDLSVTLLTLEEQQRGGTLTLLEGNVHFWRLSTLCKEMRKSVNAIGVVAQ